MKTKIMIYLSCLAGLVLISSCGTHNTLIKRHYMKGYYVAKQKDKQQATTTVASNKEVKHDEDITANLHATLAPQEVNEPILASRTDKEILPTMKKVRYHKAESQNAHRTISKPDVQLKEMVQLKKPVSSDSNGLSLFWVVILIIVILWAIGFLAGGFGLGGLINLLLVVALILLILWLLRII